MAIVKLYSSVRERVQELVPNERVTRVRTLLWMMCGMVYSRSVHLSAIAQRIPGVQKKLAKKLSKVQRLARWLDNEHVDVRVWYEPLARGLLTAAWRSRGQVRLVIDATRVSQQHQLLMVALTYRRRTLPIAWTWVQCRKGHSSGPAQEALFAYIRQLLPPRPPCWCWVTANSRPCRKFSQPGAGRTPCARRAATWCAARHTSLGSPVSSWSPARGSSAG